MQIIDIKKGKDLKIKGAADAEIVVLSAPAKVAIQPPDYKGLKPRLAVKEGDHVKLGSTIITDKNNENIKVLSPASGRVLAVNRGEKRALLSVVIEIDGPQEAEVFKSYGANEINNISREDAIKGLLDGGLWPAIRQRPFSTLADPAKLPKSIFVHAMNTEPLSPDMDVILEGREQDFQVGLSIISKLTDGKVHLCAKKGAKSKALTQSKDVAIHHFSGPHPAGNVSTHIHYVDPINKGDVVWYIEAQDVLAVAALFLKGAYPTERIIAATGEAAQNKKYFKTTVGAPVSLILEGSCLDNVRCISGSVLTGRNVGAEGYVGYFHSHVTAIPEGGIRELIGWLKPGFNKYTVSKTYASAFLPEREYSLDTDENGGKRAIVLNHLYDAYVPLDIYVYFLLKAIIAGDVDEAEKLGILECDEEDFSLATFACPSKTDVGSIIREGLELIEKEG